MEIDRKKLFIFIGLAFMYLIVFVLIIMFIWFRNDNEKYLLKYNTYTEQEVFDADWQDVWHSPQPPFLADSQRFLELKVLILFIRTPHKNLLQVYYRL